jgi:hypothetical protein
MASGGKAAHVTAEFGDDRLSGTAGHPGDGVEARDRVGRGGGARRDAAITGRDRLVQEFAMAQALVCSRARDQRLAEVAGGEPAQVTASAPAA